MLPRIDISATNFSDVSSKDKASINIHNVQILSNQLGDYSQFAAFELLSKKSVQQKGKHIIWKNFCGQLHRHSTVINYNSTLYWLQIFATLES